MPPLKGIQRGPIVPVISSQAVNLGTNVTKVKVEFADGTVVSLQGRTLQKWLGEQHYMIEKTYNELRTNIHTAQINDVLSKHTRTDA